MIPLGFHQALHDFAAVFLGLQRLPVPSTTQSFGVAPSVRFICSGVKSLRSVSSPSDSDLTSLVNVKVGFYRWWGFPGEHKTPPLSLTKILASTICRASCGPRYANFCKKPSFVILRHRTALFRNGSGQNQIRVRPLASHGPKACHVDALVPRTF